MSYLGCCGPGQGMGGLGITTAFAPLAVATIPSAVPSRGKIVGQPATLKPAVVQAAADVRLEEERAALEAELAAVRAERARLSPGWPWWAKVGGGILAAATVVAVARRWGR